MPRSGWARIREKGTAIIAESTANGLSNIFQELWRGACDGTNGFIPVFIPWFIDDTYIELVDAPLDRTPEEEDLATKYSEGPERYNRGVIGPAPIEKASPELAKIVRGSRKGETRGPFQIGEWAVILRLNNLTLAKYDSGMEERICTELFEDYINSETKKTIKELKRIFELNQSTPE